MRYSCEPDWPGFRSNSPDFNAEDTHPKIEESVIIGLNGNWELKMLGFGILTRKMYRNFLVSISKKKYEVDMALENISMFVGTQT